MRLLDWLSAPQRQSELTSKIRLLADLARTEPSVQCLNTSAIELWGVFCDGTRDILHQMFVKRDKKTPIDWGLRGSIQYANRRNLKIIYWWTLLYHVILLKHCKSQDQQASEYLVELKEAAFKCYNRLDCADVEPPKIVPWDKHWDDQYTLEAAIGIYDSVHRLLGSFNDLVKRVNHVSTFTTVTERIFEERVNRIRFRQDTKRGCHQREWR